MRVQRWTAPPDLIIALGQATSWAAPVDGLDAPCRLSQAAKLVVLWGRIVRMWPATVRSCHTVSPKNHMGAQLQGSKHPAFPRKGDVRSGALMPCLCLCCCPAPSPDLQ